jgi:hypothetical protein
MLRGIRLNLAVSGDICGNDVIHVGMSTYGGCGVGYI